MRGNEAIEMRDLAGATHSNDAELLRVYRFIFDVMSRHSNDEDEKQPSLADAHSGTVGDRDQKVIDTYIGLLFTTFPAEEQQLLSTQLKTIFCGTDANLTQAYRHFLNKLCEKITILPPDQQVKAAFEFLKTFLEFGFNMLEFCSEKTQSEVVTVLHLYSQSIVQKSTVYKFLKKLQSVEAHIYSYLLHLPQVWLQDIQSRQRLSPQWRQTIVSVQHFLQQPAEALSAPLLRSLMIMAISYQDVIMFRRLCLEDNVSQHGASLFAGEFAEDFLVNFKAAEQDDQAIIRYCDSACESLDLIGLLQSGDFWYLAPRVRELYQSNKLSRTHNPKWRHYAAQLFYEAQQTIYPKPQASSYESYSVKIFYIIVLSTVSDPHSLSFKHLQTKLGLSADQAKRYRHDLSQDNATKQLIADLFNYFSMINHDVQVAGEKKGVFEPFITNLFWIWCILEHWEIWETQNKKLLPNQKYVETEILLDVLYDLVRRSYGLIFEFQAHYKLGQYQTAPLLICYVQLFLLISHFNDAHQDCRSVFVEIFSNILTALIENTTKKNSFFIIAGMSHQYFYAGLLLNNDNLLKLVAITTPTLLQETRWQEIIAVRDCPEKLERALSVFQQRQESMPACDALAMTPFVIDYTLNQEFARSVDRAYNVAILRRMMAHLLSGYRFLAQAKGYEHKFLSEQIIWLAVQLRRLAYNNITVLKDSSYSKELFLTELIQLSALVVSNSVGSSRYSIFRELYELLEDVNKRDWAAGELILDNTEAARLVSACVATTTIFNAKVSIKLKSNPLQHDDFQILLRYGLIFKLDAHELMNDLLDFFSTQTAKINIEQIILRIANVIPGFEQLFSNECCKYDDLVLDKFRTKLSSESTQLYIQQYLNDLITLEQRKLCIRRITCLYIVSYYLANQVSVCQWIAHLFKMTLQYCTQSPDFNAYSPDEIPGHVQRTIAEASLQDRINPKAVVDSLQLEIKPSAELRTIIRIPDQNSGHTIEYFRIRNGALLLVRRLILDDGHPGERHRSSLPKESYEVFKELVKEAVEKFPADLQSEISQTVTDFVSKIVSSEHLHDAKSQKKSSLLLSAFKHSLAPLVKRAALLQQLIFWRKYEKFIDQYVTEAQQATAINTNELKKIVSDYENLKRDITAHCRQRIDNNVAQSKEAKQASPADPLAIDSTPEPSSLPVTPARKKKKKPPRSHQPPKTPANSDSRLPPEDARGLLQVNGESCVVVGADTTEVTSLDIEFYKRATLRQRGLFKRADQLPESKHEARAVSDEQELQKLYQCRFTTEDKGLEAIIKILDDCSVKDNTGHLKVAVRGGFALSLIGKKPLEKVSDVDLVTIADVNRFAQAAAENKEITIERLWTLEGQPGWIIYKVKTVQWNVDILFLPSDTNIKNLKGDFNCNDLVVDPITGYVYAAANYEEPLQRISCKKIVEDWSLLIRALHLSVELNRDLSKGLQQEITEAVACCFQKKEVMQVFYSQLNKGVMDKILKYLAADDGRFFKILVHYRVTGLLGLPEHFQPMQNFKNLSKQDSRKLFLPWVCKFKLPSLTTFFKYLFLPAVTALSRNKSMQAVLTDGSLHSHPLMSYLQQFLLPGSEVLARLTHLLQPQQLSESSGSAKFNLFHASSNSDRKLVNSSVQSVGLSKS